MLKKASEMAEASCALRSRSSRSAGRSVGSGTACQHTMAPEQKEKRKAYAATYRGWQKEVRDRAAALGFGGPVAAVEVPAIDLAKEADSKPGKSRSRK